MFQKVKNFLCSHDGWLLVAGVTVVFVSLWLVWGKVPMGDNTTELAYGMLVRAGKVPYTDFYVHITPLTTYVAAAAEATHYPVRIITLIAIGNFLFGVVIVFLFGKVLQLTVAERGTAFLLFFALHTITLVGFNHHAFDLTLLGATFLLVLLLVQASEKKKIVWYSVGVAVCATATFFITQNIGLAAILAGPLVLVGVYIVQRTSATIRSLGILLAAEVAAIVVALCLVSLNGISVAQMFKTTLTDGYANYAGTYGHWSLWKNTAQIVVSAVEKRVAPGAITNPAVTNQITDNYFAGGTIPTQNIFYKIFLNKSLFINSLLNIFILFSVLVMVLAAIYFVVLYFKNKQAPHPFVLVWVAAVGVFVLASSVVLNIGFSNFYFIFLLWLYVVRLLPPAVQKIVRSVTVCVIGIVSCLLIVANFMVLGYEHQTRQYLVSGVGNETVWLSPFYYGDFIQQFTAMKKAVDGVTTPTTTFSAYPRASEIFYLLGKVPPPGATMATFFHPGGQYQSTVTAALSSDVVVLYLPKFWGENLGSEHEFAIEQVAGGLTAHFKKIFTSRLFEVYQKKS